MPEIIYHSKAKRKWDKHKIYMKFTLLEFDRCFSFIPIGRKRSLDIIHLLVLVIGNVDRSSIALIFLSMFTTVIFGHIIHVFFKSLYHECVD